MVNLKKRAKEKNLQRKDLVYRSRKALIVLFLFSRAHPFTFNDKRTFPHEAFGFAARAGSQKRRQVISSASERAEYSFLLLKSLWYPGSFRRCKKAFGNAAR